MKSITRFMLLNASIWAIIVAFASGLVLSAFFRSSALDAFDEQLDIVLKNLVGDIVNQQAVGMSLQPPSIIGEPRYRLPLSGWYWTLEEKITGKILLSSASLVGGNLNIDKSTKRPMKDVSGFSYEGIGPQGAKLRLLQRQISINEKEALIVSVTGNLETLEARVASFQTRAWVTMALFGAFLIAVSTFLVKLALRPLDRLSEQVRKVAEGETQTIEGDYPIEVSCLVYEANDLIAANKETLERARTQVGNLAHALKTPLSVIANETRKIDNQHGRLIEEQSGQMKDQIQLYLERARIAARRSVIGSLTDVQPVLARLVTVMQKIHSTKAISYHSPVAPSLMFRGEEQDLEEIVGNILDNACKWATGTVAVSLEWALPQHRMILDEEDREETKAWFVITIQDDGIGMSEDEITLALQRGKRLDETMSGSGLGLSIVEEIVSLYHGKFVLRQSELGGLKAILVLPGLMKEE